MTYGDGVCDVNLCDLIAFHKDRRASATLTAVQPPGRFGVIDIEENKIRGFQEKPQGEASWINGGYFVLEPSVIDLIDDDSTIWERGPLETLATSGQLAAFKHTGFWQPMDTLRDKMLLEDLWASGSAPWKVWK
jgi:glucose-1-phosphate cytidylyltransferase